MSEPDLEGRTLGKYEIGEIIGRGGMAAVYRAILKSLQIEVAFKVFEGGADKLARTRFIRKARLSLGLPRHENVVFVYDAGWMAGKRFISMELIEGMDLREAVGAGRFETVDELVKIMIDICRGLEFIHRHGIVHRDIKPQNIMIDHDGTVKITDFGIARVGDGGRLSGSGRGAGTPRYMPPEVIQQQGVVDERGDIYSVGLVFYELLTGAEFFQAKTPKEVLRKVVKETLEPCHRVNRDVPYLLSRNIMKAIDKDPDRRFRSAAEFRRALEAYLDGDTTAQWQFGTKQGKSFFSNAVDLIGNIFRKPLN